MNENITDYIILTVTNPAFEENVKLMIATAQAAGGTSPTIIDGVQGPMVGTKEGAAGRIMVFFRLNERFTTEAELVTFLEQGMVGPKPPVSMEFARSAYKFVETDSGEVDEEGNPIYTTEHLVIQAASAPKFNPYMNVPTDEEGNDLPTNTFLSKYSGTDPIELV